jgi:dTDP-4-dehydrorhamnose 3,5-epimerase
MSLKKGLDGDNLTKIVEQKHPRIVTKNRLGRPNGFLVPIFNVHDGVIKEEQYPQQVYLTVASPREVKGPHLHMKRWQLYTCIKGNVKIVTKVDEKYQEYFSGEDYDYATIQVPAGIPSAIVNDGEIDAYIINMPSPAWHVDDQDEHPVSFDDYISS